MNRSLKMTANKTSKRYIYQTHGVCPSEIHFQLQGDIIEGVHFVGGGCPGNAVLVSRFLAGRSLSEVLPLLQGIDCRNDTSCPDQLVRALEAVKNKRLSPAASFRVHDDPVPRNKIGLIGDLEGDDDTLKYIFQKLSTQDVETIFCLGNITGKAHSNRKLLRTIRDHHILAIQGARDWSYAQRIEDPQLPPFDRKTRDDLLRLPHLVSFRMGERRGVAFYGDYLQTMPDYSDFEPFALEINMVCGLTNFMQDEAVFPALGAMIPQFQADIIIFSQTRQWGYWQVGGKHFISLGPAAGPSGMTWGLLKDTGGHLEFAKEKETF